MNAIGNNWAGWGRIKREPGLVFVMLWFCAAVYGQIPLSSGQEFIVESPILYSGPCAEFFTEQGIFHAPVRQVARLRLNLGPNFLDAGESLRVELFEDVGQYVAGLSARTNAVFAGPTNFVELLTPDTWTNYHAFARVEMISGSALVTNVSLATKYISGSGCAIVYRTNVFQVPPPPQLTIVESIPPFVYELYWPTNPAGYRLEEASSLSAKVWTPVTTNMIELSGSNYHSYIDTHGGLGPLPPRFFRLRRGP